MRFSPAVIGWFRGKTALTGEWEELTVSGCPPTFSVMHDHENVREDEHPEIVAHNTRLGLILFAIYCLLYGGFMGLSTFAPDVMRWQPFGGVNLAILYGFGLIAAAMILAAVYLVLARRDVSGGKGN